jgi:molybdate transport system ATP-binding protein
MERPARESVARLAGFENLLDAVVVRRDAFAGVMVCRLIGTSGATVDLETPLANVDVDHAVRIAIRAGDIIIATERPRGLSARNVLAGTIASLSQQGSIVRAEVKIGVPLEVHLTPTAAHALGLRAAEDVWLVIKTHSCRLVSAV